MPSRPEIVYEHRSAYYDRRRDVVNLPDPTDFDSPADYYSMAFQELAHSTGHKTHLIRHDNRAPNCTEKPLAKSL